MITFIALKKFDVGKQHYEPGDAVDSSRWPFRRDVLLEGQRFIRRVTPKDRAYIAVRDIPSLGGVAYAKGDRIDHSDLPLEKLEQLVNLRWLAIDDTRMAGQSPDGKGR
jgi:hypothetical protein